MMPNTREAVSSCLCGGVTIKAATVDVHVGACHCSMCRRWGGGPLLAVDCGTDVEIDGEQNVSVYDSSQWAQRGFCSRCGTHLFYRLKHNGLYVMPAGFFPDSVSFDFDHQIFIDEKPAYYEFANRTRNETGEEVFAKYAPGDD